MPIYRSQTASAATLRGTVPLGTTRAIVYHSRPRMACFNLRAGGVSLSSTANLAQPSINVALCCFGLVWWGFALLQRLLFLCCVLLRATAEASNTPPPHSSYFIIHDAHEYTGEPTSACCGPLNPMGSHQPTKPTCGHALWGAAGEGPPVHSLAPQAELVTREGG